MRRGSYARHSLACGYHSLVSKIAARPRVGANLPKCRVLPYVVDTMTTPNTLPPWHLVPLGILKGAPCRHTKPPDVILRPKSSMKSHVARIKLFKPFLGHFPDACQCPSHYTTSYSGEILAVLFSRTVTTELPPAQGGSS